MHLLSFVSFATGVPAAVLASQALPIQYSTTISDAFLRRGIPADNRYDTAVFYRGVDLAYKAYGNATYLKFIKSQLDRSVSAAGVIAGYPSYTYSLDDVRMGTILLELAAAFPNETRYKTAADTLRRQLNSNSRTPLGGFWHRDPTYANQMWLDGIFMADVFYAQYTAAYDAANTTAWSDILKQFTLIESRTYNATSKLLAHGYDESKKAVWADPVTGSAPNVWDRALGWYLMALVDVLDYFPKNNTGRQTLIDIFKNAAAGVVAAADPATGGWWLVMNEPYPGRKGNYIESSGSSMFVYALLKGVRMGYITADAIAPAKKGYEYLAKTFTPVNTTDGLLNFEGTVVVGSLGSNASFEYYTSVPLQRNDLKGVGPFIYASLEYEALA